MTNFKRNWNIFALFSLYSAKSMLQGRLGIFFFTLGKIIRFVMFFFFVYYLVSRTSTLKGYTINEAIIFYLTFNVIDSVSQIFFREVYRFRSLVVTGELDGVLIKPYHPFMRVLIGGIDVLDAVISVPYVLLTVYFLTKIPGLTPVSIIMYLLLVANALVIAMGFHILVLAFGILTSNIDHGMMIYRDLSATGRFPIEIYREPLRWFLTFVLPIGIMMTYPVKGLLGLLSPSSLLIAFGIAGAMLWISLFTWKHALQKYQSWGG